MFGLRQASHLGGQLVRIDLMQQTHLRDWPADHVDHGVGAIANKVFPLTAFPDLDLWGRVVLHEDQAINVHTLVAIGLLVGLNREDIHARMAILCLDFDLLPVSVDQILDDVESILGDDGILQMGHQLLSDLAEAMLVGYRGAQSMMCVRSSSNSPNISSTVMESKVS